MRAAISPLSARYALWDMMSLQLPNYGRAPKIPW
jgi:hypothetical protein